jgi:hypothetical protein
MFIKNKRIEKLNDQIRRGGEMESRWGKVLKYMKHLSGSFIKLKDHHAISGWGQEPGTEQW